MAPARPNRRTGILLMLAAGLCWSLGGIIVRKPTLTGTGDIGFSRVLFMSTFSGALTTYGLIALHQEHAT